VTTLTEAQRLLREGRIAEAERACEAVLERSPDDVEALNVVALAAVRGGKPVRAAALLNRATELNPDNPVSFHHLGRAHEATGNLAGAAKALAEALRLKPEFFLSRLHYASVLEASGDAAQSALQFARALHDAQARGQWVNAATTPAGLKPLVEHAVRIVRGRRRSLLFGIAESLSARYGRDSMRRVEKCLRVYLGEEPALFPDPRQQPTFLYFPDLPPSPYFDRALFPWIADFEAQTGAIRDELLRLLPSDRGRERVFTVDEVERQSLRSSAGPPTWNGYYFYRHGLRRDDNCASCPATSAALDQLPLSRVREHGPEILFSVFTAGTHLLPHRGVTNTRVVGHLPLIVPADCALNVGGEIHEWREGRVVVFDDTYEHEAWNRSVETRVVLIFDLWNPHLGEAEQAAVADIVEAIGDFRHSIENLSFA
jgi:aspartate beta-hydroxylase